MTKPNPYAPPAARVADVADPALPVDRLRPYRHGFTVAVLLQLAGSLMYAGVYLELTRRGAVSLAAFLGAAVGGVFLYVATALMAFGRRRGFVLFVLAAVSMGSSLRAWMLAYPWGWVIGWGAALAVVGCVLFRLQLPRGGQG